MKNFLVIGSNCFTGSHIVDALLENPENRVVGVSRSPEYQAVYLPYKRHRSSHFQFHAINFVTHFSDLTQLLETVKPSVVIHVAALSEVALSYERPVEYFETNTLGVVKLVNYLRAFRNLERYVHISSAEIFGSCSKPVTEEETFRPSTPYAVSKAAADLFLNTIIQKESFPALLIRSTNVYGRYQQLFKIIPRVIIFLKLGKTVELHGGGVAKKSFVHIRDVVRGMMKAMDQGKTGTYHFSSSNEDTVADGVRRICRLMGADFNQATRAVGERPGQDSRYWLDTSKARRELNWQEETAFEEGVREVIDWINENWDVIREEPLHYIHKTQALETTVRQ